MGMQSFLLACCSALLLPPAGGVSSRLPGEKVPSMGVCAAPAICKDEDQA